MQAMMIKMTETNKPRPKNAQIVALQDKKRTQQNHSCIELSFRGGKFWYLFNISIITQVIIEILVLSWAEKGVIFRYKIRVKTML